MIVLTLIAFSFFFFFFNDTATTEIYTLSLHDALPIWVHRAASGPRGARRDLRDEPDDERRGHGAAHAAARSRPAAPRPVDRKSTRLNSSHGYISYAVFCLKKKKQQHKHPYIT